MSNSQILTVIPLHKAKWKITSWCEYIFYKYIYLMPIYLSSVQFSSVAQSCPTLCDPYDHLNSRKAQFGSHPMELTSLLITSSTSWPWKRKSFSFLFTKFIFFQFLFQFLEPFEIMMHGKDGCTFQGKKLPFEMQGSSHEYLWCVHGVSLRHHFQHRQPFEQDPLIPFSPLWAWASLPGEVKGPWLSALTVRIFVSPKALTNERWAWDRRRVPGAPS